MTVVANVRNFDSQSTYTNQATRAPRCRRVVFHTPSPPLQRVVQVAPESSCVPLGYLGGPARTMRLCSRRPVGQSPIPVGGNSRARLTKVAGEATPRSRILTGPAPPRR